MTPEGMSLRQAIDDAAAMLAAAGVGSPRVDAELLAAHAAGTERGRLRFADLPVDFRDRFDALVAERAKRVPLQHLTGTAAFGPVVLAVGPGVFTPRPETEAMLEWAMGLDLAADAVIVDLCTGSGALALALAAHRPRARIIAVDDSESALAYARRNLAATAVELVAADVTTADLRTDLDGAVDLVVANPPYIPEGVPLEPEVGAHDPADALFGGPDGMAVIPAIAALALRWLRDGGRCAVEHDDTTSAQTVEAFSGAGGFRAVTPHRDLTGRPRFVTAVRTRTGGS
jgi:release factor glutamine methyltransferase